MTYLNIRHRENNNILFRVWSLAGTLQCSSKHKCIISAGGTKWRLHIRRINVNELINFFPPPWCYFLCSFSCCGYEKWYITCNYVQYNLTDLRFNFFLLQTLLFLFFVFSVQKLTLQLRTALFLVFENFRMVIMVVMLPPLMEHGACTKVL